MSTGRQRGSHYGDGTIVERGDGRFEARLSVDGKPRTVGYGKTRAAARDTLRRARAKRDEGRLLAQRSETLGHYLARWLEDVKFPQIRKQSQSAYDTKLGHVYRRLGAIALDELEPEHLEACYGGMVADGLSPTSIAITHGLLKSALKHAVVRRYVQRNVADLVRPPRQEQYQPKIFSRREVASILERTEGDTLHALWTVLLTTGVRIGEALGLKWTTVSDTSILVQESAIPIVGEGIVISPLKTARSLRLVDLPTITVDALQEHKRLQRITRVKASRWEDHDLVFCTKFGTPLPRSYVVDTWKTTLARLGIEHRRLHDTRHTVGSMLSEDGEHLQSIQGLLGHSSLGTTMRYSHLSPSIRRGVAAHIEALITTPLTEGQDEAHIGS